ncbi:MAG: ribonuclease III [Patescibacteria group bacterium]
MNNLQLLEKKIKVSFKNKKLLSSALTHTSFLNENSVEYESYERLEFLGDAVLEFIVSKHIYEHFTDIQEGRLTEIRAALVRTETLAKCAQKLHLGEYLFLSRGEEANGGRTNINILADTLEALLAAIYLEKGITASQAFFHVFIQGELDEILEKRLYIDPKSQFQEHIQNKYKVTPTYKMLTEEITKTDTKFTMGLYILDRLVTTGVGKNKKIAEHNAAVNALGKLNEL